MSGKKFIFISCFICIISLLSIFFVFLYPNIRLLGDQEIDIDVFSDYKETGYKASYLFKDVTSLVSINSDLDTTKLGKYSIKYELNYNNYHVIKKRIINVVDKEKPIIKLLGSENATLCPSSEYVEEGYEVVDNYDTNLNDKVILNSSEDEITYTVSDSSGNENSVKRKITYDDKTLPVINLVGDQNMNIYVGSSYYELGYTASDNCDGDITSKVVVTGSVNSNIVGEYKITYSVSDNLGNTNSVVRTVNVIQKQNAINGQGKVIYLTFDDGPSSSITPGILQILREEGVKATFFVINKSDSLNYLIKQAHDDGHTIALHSNTHNYAYVYSSIDNYFSDLNAISSKVEAITGVRSNIIRFPGGSSNTVSRNYQIGIMSTLTQMVLERGYSYFDWNVRSGDAGGARTQYDVYYNVVNNLVYQNNVVLLHDFDNNYKTLNALRDIIRYGKEHGYTFKAIDINTPPSRHRVNN